MEEELKKLINEADKALINYVVKKDYNELARYNLLIKEIKEKYGGEEEKEKNA